MAEQSPAVSDAHRMAFAHPPAALRPHDVRLAGKRVLLRPMAEDDWGVLLAWNNDPEVLYFAEGDDVRSRTLSEVQAIYRSMSAHAYCFIIEYEGRPVGECWLQVMNLQRILDRYPGMDLRRIDIAIGEPQLWGRGLGAEAVGLLIAFGFGLARCDAIFGCGIADYNSRSRRMFEQLGFVVESTNAMPAGSKAAQTFDLMLTRERYQAPS